MKKVVLVLLVMAILVSLVGCGGYLVDKKKDTWARSWDLTGVDNEKFQKDHEECCSYAKHKINTPFMDGMGAIPSDYYYGRCMQKRDYRCLGPGNPYLCGN